MKNNYDGEQTTVAVGKIPKDDNVSNTTDKICHYL